MVEIVTEKNEATQLGYFEGIWIQIKLDICTTFCLPVREAFGHVEFRIMIYGKGGIPE